MERLDVYCYNCNNKNKDKEYGSIFFYEILENNIYCRYCIMQNCQNMAQEHYYAYIETISFFGALTKIIKLSKIDSNEYIKLLFMKNSQKAKEEGKITNVLFYEKNNLIKVNLIFNNNIFNNDLIELFNIEIKKDIEYKNDLENSFNELNFPYINEIKNYFIDNIKNENLFLKDYYFNLLYQYIILCNISKKMKE